jgi:hypothetical protein
MPWLDKLLGETLSEPDYYLNARAILQEDHAWRDRNRFPFGCLPFSIIYEGNNTLTRSMTVP